MLLFLGLLRGWPYSIYRKGCSPKLPFLLGISMAASRVDGSLAKCWCFTLHDYTEDEVQYLRHFQDGYLIAGHEVCPDTGRKHLQGYVHLNRQKRMRAVKDVLRADRVHLEVRRGTEEEAIQYCKKEGDFFEVGEVPKTAGELGRDMERARWELARSLAKEGRFDDIPADIYMRCRSTCHSIYCDNQKNGAGLGSSPSDLNVWIYGAPGTGKSRVCFHLFPDAFRKGCNKWWNGYRAHDPAHKVVIIEDIDPNHKVLAHHLKLWADRYPFIAEVKGSAVLIRPERIIVTSNYSVERIFENAEDAAAIRRRFKIVNTDHCLNWEELIYYFQNSSEIPLLPAPRLMPSTSSTSPTPLHRTMSVIIPTIAEMEQGSSESSS